MKEDRFLHRVWRTFMSMLVMVCLCGLTFTACVDDESIVDPIYAVDLGLSVKWAWCNVGAERPEQEGNLYAWGETQVKSDYSPSNYEHNAEYTYIGTDICGTAYDAAQLAMGDGWRMPTREEIIELVSRCTWEKANLKGRDGVFVTGPNGNKIFLPNVSKGYWSGSLFSMGNNYPERSHSLSWAHSLPWLNGKAVSFKLGESYCYTGLAIRPVKGEPSVDEDVVISSKTYTVNGVSFTMIGVEGGTFTMGSPYSDSDAYGSEQPAHQVALRSYLIGETEVTQALWKAVMGSNPSHFTGDLQRSVEKVGWNDCQTFINKLNELTGENFRLPTEAEWEYAARGGKESKGYKYSGSDVINDVAWYEENSSDKTHPVKTKQPNELGLYDMTGNVWEWCSDYYGSYSSSGQTNPTGPLSGSIRVLRGGSWLYGTSYCRVAKRHRNSPDTRHRDIGLRLALSSTEENGEPEQEFITITTGKATNITFEGATLSGVVSGATNEISCGIIYGTASNITSLNNKRVGAYYNGAYSIDVSYLQPGTTYYYCAYAVIGGEELYGEVREFTTLEYNTYSVNGVSFKMIEVEGGTFTMGSPDSDSDAYSNEKPAHQVTLSSYHIGETEVTQALWQAVMGSNPSDFTGDLQRPVEQVSWNDCQTFINKLNELTGENFRLPTEAEWEYAARGGKESKGYKYSGSDVLDDVAWNPSNSSSTTHAVKTKQPNELGIYDMSGNVREWCADWYGNYSSSAQTDPTGPSSDSDRVLRGGGWNYYYYARTCRVAYRGSYFPDSRSNGIGFRLSLQFIP